MAETNAIASRESAQLQEWPRERIELLKRTMAKGATDDELTLAIQVWRRTNLDPFTRQIYFIKRWDTREKREVMQTQISVAGRAGESVETLRAIAERELVGVGDFSLGQWSEWTGRAFHLRRRLAVIEEQITGPAIDIRGDAAEVWARLLPVLLRILGLGRTK